MAVITPTLESNRHLGTVCTWEMVGGDTAEPYHIGRTGGNNAYAQITGTMGNWAVAMQGSMDDSYYDTVVDRNDDDIITNEDGLFEFRAQANYIKPVLGAGVTDAKIILRIVASSLV